MSGVRCACRGEGKESHPCLSSTRWLPLIAGRLNHSRYAEGKPIMSDEEFDKIRRVLKQRNSIAVVHKVPACRVDTNVSLHRNPT